MHIGLIGGIGPAATEFYYQNMVKAHKEVNKAMELTIVHADVETLVSHMMSGNRSAQADIFTDYVARLKAAGCKAAAVTSMAGHFCIEELIARSPLPIVNAIPVLDAHFKSAGIKTVGILGSGTVMKSHVYGGIPTVKAVLPADDVVEQVSAAYMTMARSGHASDAQRSFMFEVGRDLHENHGADAILLGGTDLFLAFDGQDPGFPVIDAALVHVAALVAQSTNQ